MIVVSAIVSLLARAIPLIINLFHDSEQLDVLELLPVVFIQLFDQFAREGWTIEAEINCLSRQAFLDLTTPAMLRFRRTGCEAASACVFLS